MNRKALITGSSRGIGKAIAYELASRGYDVLIHCGHRIQDAQMVCEEIEKKYNVKASYMQADLMDEKQVQELARFGEDADVLINNAGMALYSEFKDKTIQDFSDSMKVNLYAPFLLSQHIGRKMKEKEYGKIVNIASIDVMTTYNAQSAEYDASKAALINLTKTSSLEFAPYVNVNCVCPGWVMTDMNANLDSALLEYQMAKTCKQRMAKPEEIAKLVAFLVSDDAEFIDGEVIKIDGGYKLC